MARKKYVSPYKKFDEIAKTLITAHDMIATKHDNLIEIGVSQNTIDTLGFALKCIKSALKNIELEKSSKEREWSEFTSQFEVIEYKEPEKKIKEEKVNV